MILGDRPRRVAGWLLVLAVLVVGIQVLTTSVYFCAICGVQKWERRVLWLDFGEPAYDEFGIGERWSSAHGGYCDHLWVEGPLGGEASQQCWPELHFLAASRFVSIDELKAAVSSIGDSDLRKQDCVGRTVLHWIAIRPDSDAREAIWQELVNRGVDPRLKDRDGLSPEDWKTGIFDWHPHPWENPDPSSADVGTSSRLGAPGVIRYGKYPGANTIYQGGCKRGASC